MRQIRLLFAFDIAKGEGEGAQLNGTHISQGNTVRVGLQ